MPSPVSPLSESLNLGVVLGNLDIFHFIGPAPRMSTPRIISHTTEDWRLLPEETEKPNKQEKGPQRAETMKKAKENSKNKTIIYIFKKIRKYIASIKCKEAIREQERLKFKI